MYILYRTIHFHLVVDKKEKKTQQHYMQKNHNIDLSFNNSAVSEKK
jgi:hypothetical protein